MYLNFFCRRDLRETRQRFDTVGSEIRRKDNQIRELQQRLEVNEGCKFCIQFFFLSSRSDLLFHQKFSSIRKQMKKFLESNFLSNVNVQ